VALKHQKSSSNHKGVAAKTKNFDNTKRVIRAHTIEG